MAKDLNPNQVKKSEADAVFVAQVTEKLRHNPTYMQLEQAQRDLKLRQAQGIVDAAVAKKAKKLAREIADKLKEQK